MTISRLLPRLLALIYCTTGTLAIQNKVRYEDWNRHSISPPPTLALTADSTNLHVKLTPTNLGDADLFVAPCNMETSHVVLNYLGYSFTHGIDTVQLPSYTMEDLQEQLCAYVLGKSVDPCATYDLAAIVTTEDNQKVVQELYVSVATQLGGGDYTSFEFEQHNDDNFSHPHLQDSDEEGWTFGALVRSILHLLLTLLEFMT